MREILLNFSKKEKKKTKTKEPKREKKHQNEGNKTSFIVCSEHTTQVTQRLIFRHIKKKTLLLKKAIKAYKSEFS